jgi:predicted site-specific integrase-resolvase
MAKKSELLTSSEFSSKAGISASTVSKLIRNGKIKAVKKSGKWMIDPDQLKAKAVTKATKKKHAKSAPQKATAKAKKSSAPKAAKPAVAQKTFTAAEFAEMTYLTEKGVSEWLKCGRLAGHQDDKGGWRIDAANLDTPNIKRLIRKS